LSFSDFKIRAAKIGRASKNGEPIDGRNTDNIYWSDFRFPTLYGSDQNGSFFDEDLEIWNLRNLRNLLDKVEPKVEGLNSPYLYFGTWSTSFPWHTEDFDLLSVNYHHFGKPKIWYFISEALADRFENLCQDIFDVDVDAGECENNSRHKYLVIDPKLLIEKNISVGRVEQNPNQFILTYPRAYHSGYNAGVNCAEAINFATQRWVKYGKKYQEASKPCLY
jgi:jumonji domain-containing protein 2